MYQKLQIVFTLLAVLCVAAVLPVGSIFGFGYAGLCIVFAFVFGGLMMLCKQNHAIEERKKQETKLQDMDEKE